MLEAQGCPHPNTPIESDVKHTTTRKLRPRGADRYRLFYEETADVYNERRISQHHHR